MIIPEGIRNVTPTDKEYPARLAGIKQPPTSLWVRGSGIVPELFHLASIGSREVPPEILSHLAVFLEKVCVAYQDTAQTPLVIVSGLALGVDAQSHRVALNNVHTVGVLPTSINRMDPPANLSIAQQMLQVRQPGTAIVSEYPPIPDDQKSIRKPLVRNRITVGLSQAVLISGVSRELSGSMSAANHALHEKRPIYILEGTLSTNVRKLLMGVYKAQEVSEPQQFVDALMSLQK